MWSKAVNLLKFMVCLIPLITGEDSLQSALNAVNRRQRDLSDYRKYDDYNNADDYSRYGYPAEEDNLSFLTPEDSKTEDRNADLERAILDYLEKRVDDNSNDRISSSFRERVEKDKARQKEKMAEVFLNKLYNDQDSDSDEYFQQLQRLYEKYHKDYSNTNNPYYSNLGWENAGMQKRSRYFQPDGPSDSLYLLNYAPLDESFGRIEEDESPQPEFNWNKYSRQRKSPITYPYLKKRFPVAKRSSNYYSAPYQTKTTHQHKRSPKKDVAKTDPKVEKELNNIFSPKNESKSKTKKAMLTTAKPKKEATNNKTSKEQVPSNMSYEKPIDVKKKSINWSDYFGLDRRKKSDDVDNEWFIEKYRNAISIDSKRSDSLFGDPNETKNENKSEETKIKEMDTKLKNIEESIVDDALKFTGAHEDSIDSKEIQEVKDRIISRLAAAYSLEKMRHALNDYKQSLQRDKDKNFLKSDNKVKSEEKRVSVARKQAVDEERAAIEADNNIKCTEGEDCDEQNYKPPSEYLDETFWDKGKCPKIEHTCKTVSSEVDNYARVFEIACNIHQMCLLCENNSWYYPTRHCNVLFISKADELCDGDLECQRVARRSIKYLLHVNRSLRAEPFTICDLDCPDTR